MRISDWSSDVCSSDLQAKTGGAEAAAPAGPVDARAAKAVGSAVAGTGATDDAGDLAGDQAVATSAPLAANAPCATRIIEGTPDARLVAVDARTGKPCPDFGDNGQVDITAGLGEPPPGRVSITSAQTMVRGETGRASGRERV